MAKILSKCDKNQESSGNSRQDILTNMLCADGKFRALEFISLVGFSIFTSKSTSALEKLLIDRI